jgi:hypothetical protein
MGARQLGQGYDQMNMGAQGMNLQAQNLGLGAVGQAGQMSLGQAGVAGQLAGMGDYNRQIQQQGLDSQYNQFLEQRDWDARQLGILQGGMTGMPYGTTQSQPLQRNVGSGMLGGAASGFAVGGPIGAGIGGVLGGIFG